MSEEKAVIKAEPFTLTGVHHATVSGMRLHMRRDANGALLWINGFHMLVLNEVAADLTEFFIEGVWSCRKDKGTFSQDDLTAFVIGKMTGQYDVSEARIHDDLDKLYGLYLDVAKGVCPSIDLGLETKDIDPRKWSAPSRMDLALTYTCNNDCSFCYAECGRITSRARNIKELSTEEWEKVLDKLWSIGVPHVLFTGGEPMLRPDLVQLLRHSEEFVTGLVTNGRLLAGLAENLKSVSLDFAQVSLESAYSSVHDEVVSTPGAWEQTVAGIKKALEVGLIVSTNTTLTRKNASEFIDLLRFGKEIGLRNMACNSIIYSGKGIAVAPEDALSADELKDILSKATQEAKVLGIELQWYSPTCYLDFNPIEFGFEAKSCSAAQFNMTVEPNGRVIPCQSWIEEGCGNILTDSWTDIWNNPTCKALRNRNYIQSEECSNCEHIESCGGGCPLEKLAVAKGVQLYEI